MIGSYKGGGCRWVADSIETGRVAEEGKNDGEKTEARAGRVPSSVRFSCNGCISGVPFDPAGVRRGRAK